MNYKQNRHNIFSNMGWLFGTSVITQIVQVIVVIILTRLILPESYGIISMVMVIITFCQVFVDFGLGTALIQKKDATPEDYSTAFYMNVIISIIIYIILFFLAPILSNFYGPDYLKLTIYIRVIGITLIIFGVNSIQNAYIAKNLLFKKSFKINFFAVLISGIIAIFLAYNLPQEQRIWSLVVQYFSSSLFIALGMWFYIGWRPQLVFSKKSIKPLLKFGWKILAKGLLDALNSSIRKLIIGKQYTSADLAFYDRGQQYPLKIVKPIDHSIGSVLFPVLSNTQDDVVKLKKMARRTIQVSTYLTLPLSIGFACVAPNFVKAILIEAWYPIIPYLQIFCFVVLFRPITGIQMRSLLAIGRSDITLKCEIKKAILDVSIIGATIWFGVFWIAIGMLFSAFFGFLIYYFPTRKQIGYKFREFFDDIKYSLVITFFMAFFVLAINQLKFEPLVLLILQVIFGAILYILLSLLTKNKSYVYIFDLFKRKFLKRGINDDKKN